MTQRSGQRMEFDEAAAVFALVEQRVSTPTRKEVNDVVAQVKGRQFSERSIRPLIAVAKHFLAREAEGQSLILTDGEAQSLKKSVDAYGQSATWIKERAYWFQRWRQQRRIEQQRKQHRLERLLEQMYIPDAREVPPDLLWVREESLTEKKRPRAREIADRPLRWEEEICQEPRRKKPRSKISRCWFYREDEDWLLNDVITRLEYNQSTQLRERYESLQSEMCHWLQSVAGWRSDEATDPDLVPLAQIARDLIDPPPAFPAGWVEGRKLLDQGQRLQEEVVIFRDDLLRAVDIGFKYG